MTQTSQESQYFYACDGVTGNDARCQSQKGSCILHKGVYPIAPPPNRILLRIIVHESQASRFVKEGIRREVPVDRTAEYVTAAQELGRNEYKYRPDKVDSGSPVFGPGLEDCNILGAWEETKDYVLEDVYLLPHKVPGFFVLVLTLSSGAAKVFVGFSPEAQDQVEKLLYSTYGSVAVWANPREPDGVLTHTVTCNFLNNNDSKVSLKFAEGPWDVDKPQKTKNIRQTRFTG